MTTAEPRSLLRQCREIAHQRDLPRGGESAYRMWEDATSPYSAKMRVYFHYKGIPYRRMRTTFTAYMGTIPELVGMPIIPVILTPDDRVMQDSTPMLAWFEAIHPEPAAVPRDPRLAFVHALVEEFSDEYGPRFAMHCRWGKDASRTTFSHRIARRFGYGQVNDGRAIDREGAAAAVLARQSGFDTHLGFTPETRASLERKLLDLVAILDEHFETYEFLFGDRPSIADFALYGHLYAHVWGDPSYAPVMEAKAPNTCNWLDTITELGDTRGAVGRADFGEFYAWDALPPTLVALVRLIGETYLPLALATAAASSAGEKRFVARIRDASAEFSTHHYRAWSFEQLQLAFCALADHDRGAVAALLERAGGFRPFLDAPVLHNGLFDGLTPPFVVDGVADNRARSVRELARRA